MMAEVLRHAGYFLVLAVLLGAYLRSQRRKLEQARASAERARSMSREIKGLASLKDELLATRAARISERERLLAEREKLMIDLEATNAELERFIYTMSHDLENPLVTIRGFVGLLRKDAADGATHRLEHDMERIESAAAKMQRLIDELLELSRIGRIVSTSEEVALVEIAHEATRAHAVPIAAHGVEVSIAPELPSVFGDRVRLREVLEILIENAINYMGGQQTPRLELKPRDQGAETVVCVSDNGIGIDPRYHEKIFDLFQRLDADTEGTGVGLALAKRIVEVHGGRIWVESEGRGQGSTFCFTIPWLAEAAEPGRGNVQKES